MKHNFAKWLTFLMVGLFALALLTACGGDNQTPPTPTGGQQDSTVTPTGDGTESTTQEGDAPNQSTHDCAKEHMLSNWIIDAEASCTMHGHQHKECTICHQLLESEVIDAYGHTVAIDAAVAPTCTATGLTEGKHCSVCHAVLVKQKVIPREHQYGENDICTVCQEHRPSEGLKYTRIDGTYYEVTGIGTCEDAMIYIPSEYNGLPVKSIGDSAFSGCENLTNISIPTRAILSNLHPQNNYCTL